MSVNSTVYLSGEQLPDDFLLIRGLSHLQQPIAGEALSGLLFAWDDPSFYGTFIEKTEDGGIKLSPAEAYRLFAQTPYLQHITLVYDDVLREVAEIALQIANALQTGMFIPDLAAWKQRQIGWKLLSVDETIQPRTNRWLTLLINEAIAEQRELDLAWTVVQNQFPALYASGEQISPLLQETDWLQSIGLLPDPTPFRTCLQLMEPTAGEQDWSLNIILQDRELPERIYPLRIANSLQPVEQLPAGWIEHWERVTHDLQLCGEIIPWLYEEASPLHVRHQLTTDQAWSFLNEASLQLVQAGIHVFLPAWWEQVQRAKPRLKAKVRTSVGAARQSFFGLSQVMNFEWKVAIGSLELSEQEFEEILAQNQRLLQIRGQWIQLTPALLSQLRETWKLAKTKKTLTFREIMQQYLLGQETGEELPDEFDEQQVPFTVELDRQLLSLIHQLQAIEKIPLIEQPAGFQGTLRKYQLEGTSWLLFMGQFGLGACLADDMGLGKTVQFICYLLHRKERGLIEAPSLLICPTSVIGNWQKELERFAPSLNIVLHYGPGRTKGQSFAENVRDADLVITSYALSHLDQEELSSVQWSTICLDEAQHIKNAYTKQATAIRGLTAHHRIAMTGTPIENRLTELWSIFEFLNPGYLGGLRDFSLRYVQPIERNQDQALLEQIHRLIHPFLLRRVKNDPAIQLDLPDKLESKEYVPLTAEQGALYESAIQDMFARLEQLTPMERRGIILTTLTRLKQICDHPSLILQAAPGPQSKQRSHKVERLLEMLEDIRKNKERCLIFTQYLQMGHLLQQLLTEEGYGPVLFLHGGTPKAKRDEMISQFQNSDENDPYRPQVFILSLRAGGVGLNLTEANHVFHIDRWWNPAVENQATDRAYRIGQKRNVHVYKFVTLGTIEERIDELMERKLSLSDKIVGSGEQWITELSTSELHDLFRLRKEWID
ncbi:DEAD/DEAH box helicase [Brevibacillus fulvus]|uniref:SNF2 family DNA or RNA helicase n=1 Tax=Brevibacillus fulvus TaxID=1125967 RepID=A0A939BND0_9BACL|nr:DEAD/DEAH box helicase [Brevibacillus fulvus]MBM7588840.1 SNF2 family DNA or RNA helicase [Brevibacillus fulvus]